MAQQPHLFYSAVTSAGRISRGNYRGQGQRVLACDDLCMQLRSAQLTDTVKAVVLRVDSPGRRHQDIVNALVEPSVCTLSIWLSSLCSAMACSGPVMALSA